MVHLSFAGGFLKLSADKEQHYRLDQRTKRARNTLAVKDWDVRTEKELINPSVTSQKSPALGTQTSPCHSGSGTQNTCFNSAHLYWVLATYTYSIPPTPPSQFTSKHFLKIVHGVVGFNILWIHTYLPPPNNACCHISFPTIKNDIYIYILFLCVSVRLAANEGIGRKELHWIS